MWNTYICGKQQFLRSSICWWEFIPLSLYFVTLHWEVFCFDLVWFFCPTAVSGRASAMSNTPTHSIATSVSQPQTPTPSPIISPSAMLPIYPAIDIDAQVSLPLPQMHQATFSCILNNFTGGKQLCCIMDWALGTGFAAFGKAEQRPRESQSTFLCAHTEQKKGLWMTQHLHFLFLCCQWHYEKQQSCLLTEIKCFLAWYPKTKIILEALHTEFSVVLPNCLPEITDV